MIKYIYIYTYIYIYLYIHDSKDEKIRLSNLALSGANRSTVFFLTKVNI